MADPDVLQIRLGANATLVIIRVRDPDARGYQLALVRGGAITERVSVLIPEDQHERVAKFLAVPFYVPKSRITDDFPVEINPSEEVTRPEKVGK